MPEGVELKNLKPNSIIRGRILPEPVQIITIARMGTAVKIIGKGLNSGKVHEAILELSKIQELEIAPEKEPFDGDPTKFRLGIEANRLALAYEYDPYFSLSIARIDPLPHQLEAVYDYLLKIPRIRFLLADDPGAGKTIMAGLLLKELKMRGLAVRTLIVSPANLIFQWQREMKDKFREQFDLIRGVDLRNAYGTNPWQEKQQVITSIDWAKRAEVQESLKRSEWDLIIVDEAHKMSARDYEHKNIRYQLGEALSKSTDHFLLLTATPHKGDVENFCLFLQLLDRDVYGDVKSLREAIDRNSAPFYLRRRKEALVSFPDNQGVVKKLFTKREVQTSKFELDGEEFDFYHDLTRYVENQSIRAADDDSPRGRALGFTMAMLQRRFASTIYAVRRSLERRRDRLQDQIVKPRPTEGFDESRLEDLDDLPEEEVQKILDQIEAASLAGDREAIQEEINDLNELIKKAQQLEAREVESKLRKLKELLKEQEIFQNPKNKLLIFTEHKDTLYYLVGNQALGLKGKLVEWGLKVTQIHGGMKIGDRDTPGTRLEAEKNFKDEDGAQVMVATEAAGEGINLQFCWIMINYDLPWNPMRLEQRMGRIHRYGQEHDCLIFNFCAMNTREGKVMERLLSRLKNIQQELGEDQVFDVIGEVFPSNLLERMFRDLYTRRTTEKAMLDRIVHEVDPEHFRSICQSALEGLAKKELNLTAIVGKTAEAKERRLVPEIIERFFLEAAPLSGINPTNPRKSVYRIGRVPRILHPIGQRCEPKFGVLAKEYKLVAFSKDVLANEPTLEWVTPGHPLFEAVRENTLSSVLNDLSRGAIFYDLQTKEPYTLDVFAASIKDGRGRAIHRRLFVIQTDKNGSIAVRQPTLFLDLIPNTSGADISGIDNLPDKALLEHELLERALKSFLKEVSDERSKELETIEKHVKISLNELIKRQQLIFAELSERGAQGEELSGNLSQAEARLEELNDRLKTREDELAMEREFTIADVNHLGRALVLAHPERTGFARMIRDEEIELIAMHESMEYERKRGWIPEDVSAEDRGFDILSKNPKTGEVRFVEAKGRSTVGEVILTENEFRTAERLKKDFWLYVVYNCNTSPVVHLVQDPARLGWEPIVKIQQYHVAANVILEAESK